MKNYINLGGYSMSWKEIKKIDAHIHILHEEKRLEFIKY